MRASIILGIFFFFSMTTIFSQNKKKVESGKATYYAKKFHNRKTTSGIKYHQDSLVCAHRKYPFGTKLLVKNLQNLKEVIVEVIDRGPHKKGRIVDLSYAAAKELDMIRAGVISVELSEYIPILPVLTDSTAVVLADSVQINN